MKILIALPVYNEELVLEKNAKQVLNFCRQNFISDEFKIVISDNNSNDRTAEIGRRLATEYPEIDYLFIERKGKGLAIKSAWQKFDADVYCFMDADLATDLRALPALIEVVDAGNNIAYGSRFHPLSKVERPFFRRFTSAVYRLLVKLFLSSKINDAPCGFKAISRRVRDELLPDIQDESWFFDSELLIAAACLGYQIKEIPINWSEFRDLKRKSTVNIFKTTIEYLRRMFKLKKRLKNLSFIKKEDKSKKS